MSEACCLTVPLSHSGCLAEFCMDQTIKHHNIHFLHRCPIYLYVVLNNKRFSKKQLQLAVWQYQELHNPCYHFILVCLPLDIVAELTCWLRWCAVKYYVKNRVDIFTVIVVIGGDYCSETYIIISIIISAVNYNSRTTQLTAQYCICWNIFHMFLYNI